MLISVQCLQDCADHFHFGQVHARRLLVDAVYGFQCLPYVLQRPQCKRSSQVGEVVLFILLWLPASPASNISYSGLYQKQAWSQDLRSGNGECLPADLKSYTLSGDADLLDSSGAGYLPSGIGCVSLFSMALSGKSSRSPHGPNEMTSGCCEY